MIEQQVEAMQLPLEDRERFLENHCTDVKEGQYFRRFDEADKQQIQEEFMMKAIELKRKQDEFDDIKSSFKAQLKVLEDSKNVMMTEIMQNGEWLTGKQFGFDNQVTGTMTYLNKQGDFIESRRLLPNERQLSINSKVS